jgi:hypothetical protein
MRTVSCGGLPDPPRVQDHERFSRKFHEGPNTNRCVRSSYNWMVRSLRFLALAPDQELIPQIVEPRLSDGEGVNCRPDHRCPSYAREQRRVKDLSGFGPIETPKDLFGPADTSSRSGSRHRSDKTPNALVAGREPRNR